MNKTRKIIQRSVMWTLITFGVGLFVLVQVVNLKGLVEWQDAISKVTWVYLVLVLGYSFFSAVSLIVDRSKRSE